MADNQLSILGICAHRTDTIKGAGGTLVKYTRDGHKVRSIASPEGQKGYDQIGRGSPYVEGSEKWTLIRKVGAKTIFGGWQASDYEPAILKKIVTVWGFPTAK